MRIGVSFLFLYRQYAARQELAAPSTWMVLWHQCAECEESVDLEVAIAFLAEMQIPVDSSRRERG